MIGAFVASLVHSKTIAPASGKRGLAAQQPVLLFLTIHRKLAIDLYNSVTALNVITMKTALRNQASEIC